jgi:hypothetical protein
MTEGWFRTNLYMSAGDYDHELKVEIFSVGQERLGQKYILLDRQVTSFTATRENDRSHEFKSDREVTLFNYEVSGEPRGETYAAHLITITDPRGEIIGVATGSDWLYENLDNLRELKPGNYMNKKCERVFPTQPFFALASFQILQELIHCKLDFYSGSLERQVTVVFESCRFFPSIFIPDATVLSFPSSL